MCSSTLLGGDQRPDSAGLSVAAARTRFAVGKQCPIIVNIARVKRVDMEPRELRIGLQSSGAALLCLGVDSIGKRSANTGNKLQQKEQGRAPSGSTQSALRYPVIHPFSDE